MKKLFLLLTFIAVCNVYSADIVIDKASLIKTNTTNFNNVLNSSDNTVQKALDKVDNFTETDPKVNTVAIDKWCKGSGTQVDCSTDAPVITESDPTFDTKFSGKDQNDLPSGLTAKQFIKAEGTVLPVTCIATSWFFDTDSDDCVDTPGGAGTFCYCETTNVWIKSTGSLKGMSGGSVTGDVPVTGDVSVTERLKFTTNNLYIGNDDTGGPNAGNGSNIWAGWNNGMLCETCSGNIGIGNSTAMNHKYAYRNTWIGQLGAELDLGYETDGARFNIQLTNYSGGQPPNAIGTLVLGGHAGVDGSYSTVLGFESGIPSAYTGVSTNTGDYNFYGGGRTGFLGNITNKSCAFGAGCLQGDNNGDHLLLLGWGTSAGSTQHKEISIINTDGGTPAKVQITATNHGLSDGNYISFRDLLPYGLVYRSTETLDRCVLAPDNSIVPYFKVASATADTFLVQWCRAIDGTTSNWNTETKTCSAWNTANWSAVYDAGDYNYTFNDCIIPGTGAFVHKMATTTQDYSFMTAVGANTVGDQNNTVFIGRKGMDSVVVGKDISFRGADHSTIPIPSTRRPTTEVITIALSNDNDNIADTTYTARTVYSDSRQIDVGICDSFDNEFHVSGHNLLTGHLVRATTTDCNLTTNSFYYVTVVDENTIKLDNNFDGLTPIVGDDGDYTGALNFLASIGGAYDVIQTSAVHGFVAQTLVNVESLDRSWGIFGPQYACVPAAGTSTVAFSIDDNSDCSSPSILLPSSSIGQNLTISYMDYDSFTLPSPHTVAHANCYVYSVSDTAYMEFIFNSAGAIQTIGTPDQYQTTLGADNNSLTFTVVSDKLVVTNELGQPETITCEITYD